MTTATVETQTPEQQIALTATRIERALAGLARDLTKQYEELARRAHYASDHFARTAPYLASFADAVMVAPRSSDPIAEFDHARHAVQDAERTFEKTAWLLGIEPEQIDARKAECRASISEMYRSYYAVVATESSND